MYISPFDTSLLIGQGKDRFYANRCECRIRSPERPGEFKLKHKITFKSYYISQFGFCCLVASHGHFS